MKKMGIVLLIAVPILGAFTRPADPLKNTKWEGTNGLTIYFTQSDTVKLMMKDQLLSSSLYKVKDSLLTWRDYIVSDATCDTSIRGIYLYRIKEDVLTFRTVSDRCEDRANVIQTLVLTKK